MSEIKAGVVLVTKFIRPGSKAFAGYIDYIDREEAVRNEYSDKWNGYVDYMGNPEKTSDLFSAGTDCMSDEEKQHLKQDFVRAQENGNLMWQTVISFDNRWLEKQGLYDSATNTLNVDKVKELTRNSMKKMLEKEGIAESAVWSASIHYNTDNIHIHVATVEPEQTLRPKRENGEPKGVWRQSTLNAGKASIVNNILMQQQENQIINDLIRKNMVGGKRDRRITYDKDLRQAFLKVYQDLPSNKQYWNYNSTNLGNRNRMNLDELSHLYIQKYHQRDFEEFQQAVQKQQEKYREAYGSGDKIVNRYAENKERELYERMGNCILKEMKEYDRELKGLQNKEYVNHKLSGDLTNKLLTDRNIQKGLRTMGKSMNRMQKAFKKDFQSMKNLSEYEKLQHRIEQQKRRQDIDL